MPPTLEECIAVLGRSRAAAILAPHVQGQVRDRSRSRSAHRASESSNDAVAAQPPEDLPYKSVACVGTGTVGASWAAFYASRGLRVTMYDSSESALGNGVAKAKDVLKAMESSGQLAPGFSEKCAALLVPVDSLASAVCEADFVQETVFEDYSVKHETWRGIEANATSSTVIASSTSGLLISRLASVLKNPERALIAHPFNPPHVIRLVELALGPNTDPDVLRRTKDFFEKLGKVPVVLQKEVSGHIANRLQAAVWRESISLVHQGVATVADVDAALHEGPGVRWAILGMHAIFDLGGGEGGYRGFFDGPIGKGCFEQVWPEMDAWPAPPPQAKEAAIAGIRDWHKACGKSRADIAAWRDARLAEILDMKSKDPLVPQC